jgi:hypothetical protein
VKAALLIALVGCTDYQGERATTHDCPHGETCSPLTPDGLSFIGDAIHDGQIFVPQDNHPTAVGGTQDFSIDLPDGHPLDLPYTAEVGGTAVALVGQHGTTVTVRGIASGYAELKIRDAGGLLMDETQVQAVPVDSISIAPASWESYGNENFVVAPDHGTLALQIGAVDTAMQATFFDGQRAVLDSHFVTWDEVEVPSTPGALTVSVTAGDHAPIELPVTVVSGADAVAALDPNPASIGPRGAATLCFEATNASRPVMGLTWQFTVDGVATDGSPIPVNCVGFTTTKSSGTVSVTATAGGAAATVTIPVMP